MANTRELRRRIKSVTNTKQLTRAMKMVSAAKLRRARENILSARPYARRMKQVLASVASRAGADAHPLLAVPDGNKSELVVVTADKGLCGGFNTNMIKRATRFLEEHTSEDGGVGYCRVFGFIQPHVSSRRTRSHWHVLSSIFGYRVMS